MNQNMFYNYVYSQEPSYFMDLNTTFTLCQSTLSNLWHSNSYAGFQRGIESIEKVIDFKIGFQDFEKVLNFAKMHNRY